MPRCRAPDWYPNLSFSLWANVFEDAKMTRAQLDRLNMEMLGKVRRMHVLD